MARCTRKVCAKICERIAMGEGLVVICREDGMPDKATVFRWLQKKPWFREMYEQARDFQADTYADEVVHLADTAEPGEVKKARLRIDTRKWVACKLKPKKYGDRQQVDLNAEMTVNRLTDEQVDARLLELCRKAGIALPARGEGEEEAAAQALDVLSGHGAATA